MKFFVLTLLITLAASQVVPPLPIGPLGLSPLVPSPGPYIPNFAPRFAPPLFNPFLNPAVNPAIPGMFNTLLQGNIMGGLFGKRSVEEGWYIFMVNY